MDFQASVGSQLGSILVVGGGKMGQAIVAGLLNARVVQPSSIAVANPGLEKRLYLQETYGVTCYADAAEAPCPDTCIFAVKPQVMRAVMQGLAEVQSFAPTRIVSIAAGITTATIQSYFPHAHVVRGMPNTPLMVGQGMVGLSVAQGTPASEGELVRQMFACMGGAVVVDESLQDAVVAISGSGPAYFALFVKELARAGVELGLPDDLSLELALQTMVGTGELLRSTGQTPDQLIHDVTSPGGTTQAALQSFEQSDISSAIARAAQAAAKRSKELS